MPTVYQPHHYPQPVTCSPSAHTICSYDPYPVDVPHYQPHHPYPLYLTPSPSLTTPALPSTGTALPGATQPPQTSPTTPSPSSRTISTTTTLTPWMSILTPTLPPQPSLSPGLSPRPSLRCLAGQMMVSLPSALLDSIQVKGQNVPLLATWSVLVMSRNTMGLPLFDVLTAALIASLCIYKEMDFRPLSFLQL